MQVGDVVYLKSGGRAMTVTTIDSDGTIRVAWDGGSAGYPEACLVGDYPEPVLAKKRREIERANADEVAVKEEVVR